VSLKLVRWGGVGAIVAGVAYAGLPIVIYGGLPIVLPELVYVVVAQVGTAGGIAGLHALQRGRYGPREGFASFAYLAAFIGTVLILVSAAALAFVGQSAGQAAFLVALSVSFVGFLAALVGLMLLGAATLQARVLPRWCGVLLIVGIPVSLAPLILGGNPVGLILLGAIWLLVGYALLRAERRPHQPTRTS
jgi:hypothetical protein